MQQCTYCLDRNFFKGTLAWDFTWLFFHKKNLPGALMKTINLFQIWILICPYIWTVSYSSRSIFTLGECTHFRSRLRRLQGINQFGQFQHYQNTQWKHVVSFPVFAVRHAVSFPIFSEYKQFHSLYLRIHVIIEGVEKYTKSFLELSKGHNIRT